VGIGAGLGKFAVLFDVAGGVGAEPQAWENEGQTPGYGGRDGRATPQLEQIKRGGEKA
jgi:hypothetical protein